MEREVGIVCRLDLCISNSRPILIVFFIFLGEGGGDAKFGTELSLFFVFSVSFSIFFFFSFLLFLGKRKP